MDFCGLQSKQVENKWSLEDELKLLNAISNCGHGNWRSISLEVPPYSPLECEQHYNDRFVFNMRRGPALCSNNCKIEFEPVNHIPFSCSSISEMNEHIKSMDETEHSNSLNKCSAQSPSMNSVKSNCNKFRNYMIGLPYIGYNRIRSDFDIEYDNNAENLMKMISESNLESVEMDEEESSLFHELEFVLYQSYNESLKQRRFRKKVVRDHCLLDRRKTFNMLQRLDVAYGTTTLKALIPVMRFLNGPEFDYLVEKLKYQIDLKLKMSLYMVYRSNGMKFRDDIDIYKKLKNKRSKYNAQLSCLSADSDFSKNSDPNYNRKPSAPLALAHLPGYNLLNEDEKRLCSTYRIVPETYNSFKEVLIAECEKHNGLRLAQARNLIKIDVNKTRKIYDYLVSLNLIWQPES